MCASDAREILFYIFVPWIITPSSHLSPWLHSKVRRSHLRYSPACAHISYSVHNRITLLVLHAQGEEPAATPTQLNTQDEGATRRQRPHFPVPLSAPRVQARQTREERGEERRGGIRVPGSARPGASRPHAPTRGRVRRGLDGSGLGLAIDRLL